MENGYVDDDGLFIWIFEAYTHSSMKAFIWRTINRVEEFEGIIRLQIY